MELQLLLILVVAFVVFGPEKMLEFATQLGKIIRKVRQEWASIQLELQAAELKEQLKKTTLEGEQKVKQYLSGETEQKPKSQKEFLDQLVGETKTEPSKGETSKKELTMEDLFSGNAPVVDDETEKPKGGTKPS